MLQQILHILLLPNATGSGLAYSWSSFLIGRMFFKRGQERAAFLWVGLGILAAIIYFCAGCFLGAWIGAILLGGTVAMETWIARRWPWSQDNPNHNNNDAPR
jgi:hypothetical protein